MSLSYAIFYAANKLFDIIYWLIFARVIVSWLPFNYGNRTFYNIVAMINSLTEPFMAPVRNLLSKTALGRTPVDFSPFVVMILLQILQYLFVYLYKSFLLGV